MNDAVLYFGLREYRFNSGIKPCEVICTGNENIFYAAISQSIKNGRPVFCTFVLSDPHAENVLFSVQIDANGDINGFLDNMLAAVGIEGFNIINTPAAIVLGMIYDYLPFMVFPIYNVLVKIDDNVINAARDLGANFWQTLFKIIIPLSKPGIASGIIMVFVPALTTFVISDILGGGKLLLIGNIVENKVKADNLNLAAGLSLVLMVFIIINMLATGKDESDAKTVKEGKKNEKLG